MRQQRSYPIEAIVLKRTDIGEADRILTLFTPNRGKMRAVAKGIRRPISKKAGHLELLNRSQLQIALGRNLDIITQAEGRENFLHLRNQLWHMTCGYYLVELVDRFVEDSTPHFDIYTLLLAALRYLDADASALQQQRAQSVEVNTEPIDEHGHTRLLLRYFEIRLLTAIGYEPVLQQCAHCANELRPEENGFRASLGGALCPQCSRFWERHLSLNALKVLRFLQQRKWIEASYLNLDAKLQVELEAVMHDLLRFHLERDLKSWSFLDMLHVSI
ncbi:MAG: DNA repair protein RecO [Ktedonobacteraceae bacterium]